MAQALRIVRSGPGITSFSPVYCVRLSFLVFFGFWWRFLEGAATHKVSLAAGRLSFMCGIRLSFHENLFNGEL